MEAERFNITDELENVFMARKLLIINGFTYKRYFKKE